jgi:hypothetical protein
LYSLLYPRLKEMFVVWHVDFECVFQKANNTGFRYNDECVRCGDSQVEGRGLASSDVAKRTIIRAISRAI